MTDYERIYNAAIALNNTAVHLIQQRKYFEASETLQDAIKCTKAFCNGGSGVDVPSVMQNSEYDQALEAARFRKNDIETKVCTSSNSKYRNNILVVSDQDDPQTIYDTLEQNRSLMCCVTIDPIEKFDMYDVDRLQVESALIIYNFGIVHRCIAGRPAVVPSHVKDGDNAQVITNFDVFYASLRILDLTRCLTTNLLSALSFNGSRSLHISSNLLLATVLVLTNLYQMSEASCFIHATHQYYLLELSKALELISERNLFLISENYQISLAPAA